MASPHESPREWQQVPGLRLPLSMRPKYKSSDNPLRREVSALTDGLPEPSAPKSARGKIERAPRAGANVSFTTPAGGSQSARAAMGTQSHAPGVGGNRMMDAAGEGYAARSGLALPGLTVHEGGRTSYCATNFDERGVMAAAQVPQVPLPPAPPLPGVSGLSGVSTSSPSTSSPRHPFKGEKARPSNRSEAALLSAQLDMALADPTIGFRAEQKLHEHVFEEVVKQVSVHCGERGALLQKLRKYYMSDKELTMRSATRAARQSLSSQMSELQDENTALKAQLDALSRIGLSADMKPQEAIRKLYDLLPEEKRWETYQYLSTESSHLLLRESAQGQTLKPLGAQVQALDRVMKELDEVRRHQLLRALKTGISAPAEGDTDADGDADAEQEKKKQQEMKQQQRQRRRSRDSLQAGAVALSGAAKRMVALSLFEDDAVLPEAEAKATLLVECIDAIAESEDASEEGVPKAAEVLSHLYAHFHDTPIQQEASKRLLRRLDERNQAVYLAQALGHASSKPATDAMALAFGGWPSADKRKCVAALVLSLAKTELEEVVLFALNALKPDVRQPLLLAMLTRCDDNDLRYVFNGVLGRAAALDVVRSKLMRREFVMQVVRSSEAAGGRPDVLVASLFHMLEKDTERVECLKALAANEAFAEKELDVLLEHLKEMRPAAFGGAEGGGGGGGGGGGKSGGNSKRGNLTKPRDPPELMTLGQCNGIVAMVWQRKVREDILADQKKKPHVKFSKFVHDHLLRQYGTKSMADKKLRDLTHSVRTFELNETGNPLQPRFKMVAEMAGLLGYDEWSDEKTSFCLAFLALCLSMDQQGDPIAYVRRVTAAANEEANAGASAQPGKGKKTSLQNLFKASKSTDASSKAAAMEAKLNMLMPPNMKDLLIKAELNVTTQAVEATVTVFVTQEAARQRVIDELEELTFGGEREMNFVAGGKQEVQLVNLDEVMASVVMPAWQDAEQRKQLEWQAVLAGMFEEADDNGNGLMEFCELRDLNEKEGSRIGLDVITTVFDEAVRNSSLETGVEMDSITLRAFVKMCMDHSLFQIESGSQRTFLDPKDITFGADLGAGGMGANGAVAGAANAFKSRAKRRSVPIPTLQELTKDKAERMVQVEKDEAISSVLKSALQQNFLFRHLDDKLLDEVVGYMTELTAKAGDTIIKEGSKGDYLYLAEKGTFDVLVQGSKVHEYVCKEAESERPIFGELALMYAKPRAASVMATADSRLWKLGRGGFRLVQAHASGMLDPVQVLRKVEIFASLRFDQLQTLRDTMKELHYEAGQMVFKEGDDGDGMYIVGTGQVAVIKRELANGQYVDKEAFTLGESAYFGERALLEHKPRAAGIKAVVPTKCMFISRGEFERVLGPLQALLDEDRRKREGAANQRQKQLQAKGLAKATRSSFRLEVPVFQHPCGVAYLATHSESGECYTLRQETKEHIIRLRDEQRVQREVEVLRSLDELDLTCTVLPTLLRTFQTPDSVYMLLRQRTACDLAQLVEDVGPLDGPPLRFVAACVASALEVLHSPALHSVYRHLMPEALALLDNGYVCLMDLKHCENEWRGCQTLCGSPLYFAPEMVRGEQQTSAVDMWAMGVLLYELASGESPWGSDANECDDVTLLKRIAEHTDDGLRTPSRVRALRREGEDGSPDGGSSPEDTEALLELLTPLLQPAIEERHTAAAIKAHPFLAQVEWAKLKEAEAPSPLMDAASSLLTRKVQTMDWEELEAAPWEPDMGETLRLNGLDPFADF